MSNQRVLLLQLAFDWVGGAFLSILSMSTPDSWESLLADGLDATAPDYGPIRGKNPGAAAYFVLGVFFAYFIIVNMFKSVFIELFQYNSARIEAADRSLRVPVKPTREELPDVWEVSCPAPSLCPSSPAVTIPTPFKLSHHEPASLHCDP